MGFFLIFAALLAQQCSCDGNADADVVVEVVVEEVEVAASAAAAEAMSSFPSLLVAAPDSTAAATESTAPSTATTAAAASVEATDGADVALSDVLACTAVSPFSALSFFLAASGSRCHASEQRKLAERRPTFRSPALA